MITAYALCLGQTSLALLGLDLLRALHRRRPVALIPLDQWKRSDAVPDDVRQMLENGSNADPRDPAIGIGSFDRLRSVRGEHRIGLVVWETTRIAREKMEILHAFDEVWTPSRWGRQMLIHNGLDADRVHVVPAGVDPRVFRPLARERRVGEPFRFLCVGRWTVRKGVDDLVAAYCCEFKPDEPVELVLHTWDRWRPVNLDVDIAKAARGAHAPIVGSMPVPVGELVALYNRADAFVLATRGEGWGLPITEAMACGLPVIVTNYSAPADYLDESIAYPLRVERMIDVHDRDFPQAPAAGQWAQPDVGHLRALMRHVYENRDEAREKGRRAAEAMRTAWTWDHAAGKACAILERRA